MPDAAARPAGRDPGRGGELEIVVKSTNRCNAACTYCSAGVGERSAARVIDLPTARRICAEAAALVEGGAYRSVQVLWHGGEPLTLGKAFFRALLPDARTDVLRHQVQTNLLAIDEEWLEILEPLVGRDGLGTSCDPFSDERRFAGGSYQETWLEKMRLLQGRGWRVGCVFVLGRSGLGVAEEAYWFFRNLGANGSVSLGVNPLLPVGDALRLPGEEGPFLAPGELARFLRGMASAWARDGFRLRIRPLSEWMEWLGGAAPRLPCNLAGAAGCAAARCGITPDGSIHGCGRAFDAGAPPIGSLRDASLGELLALRAREGVEARERRLREGECAGCRAWPVCHGGCPHEGVFAGGPAGRTASCRDVLETLDHLEALRRVQERRAPRRRDVGRPAPGTALRIRDAAGLAACVAEGRQVGIELPEPLVGDYLRAAAGVVRPPWVAALTVERATDATLPALEALPQLVRPSVLVTAPQARGEPVEVLGRLLARGHRVSLQTLAGWEPEALAATAALESGAPGATLDPWSAMRDFAANGDVAVTLPTLLDRPGASFPEGRCLTCPVFKFCRGLAAPEGESRACDVVVGAYLERCGAGPGPGEGRA